MNHRAIIEVICFTGFCLWISLSLMLRMWVVHTRAKRSKKIIWSCILLIPFLGWLAYGACFVALDSNGNQCPTEHSSGGALGGGDGGGHF